MVNHAYGRLAKVLVPALMAWNTTSRPIFLCRSGETKLPDKKKKKFSVKDKQVSDLSEHGHVTKRLRGDRLNARGLQFRDKLCEFVLKEGMEYMEKNTNVMHPRKFDTGTSMSGLREHRRDRPLFPCLVMSSTMPRALETAQWNQLPFPIKDVSNLNPLDMGEFAGMDLETMRKDHPKWFKELEQEPFHTRCVRSDRWKIHSKRHSHSRESLFPGGEGYSDLINRLESVVIDMEQHLGPTVVVSHLFVVVHISHDGCFPRTEIPMHTVLKFVPLRGGGWLESHHKLLPDEPTSPAKGKATS
eukprot:scaffold29034_cov142-Amphora_coffeaeformis.AAC.1